MNTPKAEASSVQTEIAATPDLRTLSIEHFSSLIELLRQKQYTVYGPTVRDRAIIYDEITSVSDLPSGWVDSQNAATYRLSKRAGKALFNFTVGPHSWKKLLHAPKARLWHSTRSGAKMQIEDDQAQPVKQAFIGVRACEARAIQIQDRVFLEGPYVDPLYKKRRENTLIIAVNCEKAGGTCFCASMGTGPKAAGGFDLALTEIQEDNRHYFLAEVGSAAGEAVLSELSTSKAEDTDIQAANRVVVTALHQMGRKLDTTDLKQILYRNSDSPRWAHIAERCMSCGNCTLVCPTCFCTTIEDVTDLRGALAERWRTWDSCFTMDFSYIHGGSVRTSPGTRYRQWLTHKLATWYDQFGSAGCVGCGRCITWCPVGIDITEEARAIRESDVIDAGAIKAKE